MPVIAWAVSISRHRQNPRQYGRRALLQYSSQTRQNFVGQLASLRSDSRPPQTARALIR
jgi:hypothetical protein